MNILLVSLFIILSTAEDPLGIADDCPRIRRPWHQLSKEERNVYISAIIQLRANGNGDPDTDEFIAIASVHEDEFAPVTHKASNYLYWHGYLTWELETRIRALGGEYSCFGMPYWDFTMEAGREDDPFVLQTGLGGNGNKDDYYTINEYSWPYTTDEFWVPFNCYAQNDQYPICSLKRALRPDFEMATAQEMGRGIIDNPEFAQFAKWYATGYNPVHLFTNAAFLESPNPVTTSYDPIWYLFHSMVQYHQAIWTDCNQYDLIAPEDLDNHPNAYKPYCVHGECTSPNKYDPEWMGMGLDDVMHFGGSLEEKEWSYIHNEGLTVRKLYHLPRWGIVYDLGSGEGGFYERSGLKEHCDGKLNDRWFITNNDNPYAVKHDENVMASSSKSYGYFSADYVTFNTILLVIAFLIAVIGGLCYIAKKERKKAINDGFAYYSYGSFYS